ncbi:Pre-mRNA-processing factor 39 [Eumeta japonica]|uniref:Pre-mRNA-processing factor 39 n=1 Tax=Eumeta variegata TaxID=151549 RepID=A0A4C1SS55_EUMVA|nr:Pre-mRNA-processing factor 39 [Eumeta japonica]
MGNEGKRYQNMVKIYDRLIAIPTQGYSGHFNNFQDLINQHSITDTITPEEIKKLRLELKDSKSSSKSSSSRSKSRRASSKDKDSEANEKDKEKEKEKKEDIHEGNKEKSDKNKEKSDKIANEETSDKTDGDIVEPMVIDMASEEEVNTEKSSRDVEDLTTLTEDEITSIKDKVISSRRKVHKSTVSAITARWTFEEAIKGIYFHVKPLERCQLKNRKDYLDFEIEKGDRKRILVLFERCLIACAFESSPSRKSGHKEASSLSTSAQSAYNNGGSSSGAASYNYGSGNSAYYAQQNSGGGSYPQQQQSYDNYYNHWQYNTGYSGYGQWSGYTNYY